MFKSSRRVFGVATAMTLGALIAAPSASAALLGSGSSSGSSSVPALAGVPLPLSGDLLAPVGSLLGSGGAGGLLGGSSGYLGGVTGLLGAGLLGTGVLGNSGGGLLSGVTGVVGGTGLLGGAGGVTGVTGVLGGVTGVLGGGGLLGGGAGVGAADSAGGDLLDGVFQSVGGTTLACDAAVPQVLSTFVGDAAGAVCALNPFDGGLVGLLGVL
ncbi:MAG TPA: hypothetical protein VKX24_08025 [Acidimicrobiia bacterium]|nr:hypothetical protein [Acidimicrobiia bacterium]